MTGLQALNKLLVDGRAGCQNVGWCDRIELSFENPIKELFCEGLILSTSLVSILRDMELRALSVMLMQGMVWAGSLL